MQGNATTIRDASLGEISLVPAQHIDIHQDPSSPVARSSYNISAANSVLPEQSQTLQLGTASCQKLPVFEPNSQSIKVPEGIADTMQDGKSHGRKESLNLIGASANGHNSGHHNDRLPQ